ncbi:unnamed protein product [Caenorhabditis nigoni]
MVKRSKHFPTEDEFTQEEDEAIWMYLHGKVRRRNNNFETFDVANMKIWKEFRTFTRGKREPYEYQNRFLEVLAPALHETEFDDETKTELYYSLSIPVEKNFVEYLKQNGDLELDDVGCIETFTGHNGIQLGVRSKRRATVAAENDTLESSSNDITEQVVGIFWDFLLQRVQKEGIVEKLEIEDLCREFMSGVIRMGSPNHLHEHFVSKMAPVLHLTPFLTIDKVKLYYALNIVVDANFLKMLKRKAVVTVNELGQLTSFGELHYGGLVLGEPCLPEIPEPPVVSKFFSADEEMEMWMFLLEKTRNPWSGKTERKRFKTDLAFWAEFKQTRNGEREPEDYMNRYDLVMKWSLYQMQLPLQIKVELHYGLHLPMDRKFIEELKNHGYVELDKSRRLTKYKSKASNGFKLGYPEIEEEEEKMEYMAPSFEPIDYDVDLDPKDDMIGDISSPSDGYFSDEFAPKKKKKSPHLKTMKPCRAVASYNSYVDRTIEDHRILKAPRKRDSCNRTPESEFPEDDEKFIEPDVYLKNLQNALSKIKSPLLNPIRKKIDYKMRYPRGALKPVPVNFFRNLVKSISARYDI